MCRTDQYSSAEISRQRWAGLAVLLAVAISTGFAPSAMAWALVPGAERALLLPSREVGQDRAAARQIQDAIARAVREFLKGKSVDVAAVRPAWRGFVGRVSRSPLGITGPAAVGLVRSERAGMGRLPQPPPVG